MKGPIGIHQSRIRKSPIFNLRSAILTLSLASVGLIWLVTPAAPERLDSRGWGDLAARTVPGAYHIHTTRSDGVGDRTAVAAAAARAGMRFVILTDHGDATRPPDPPEYINGVLVLDAVEISTDQGHYVAHAPIDGIEWLNADSEWRADPRLQLARAGLAYFLRPGPALATLFDRPTTLDRWDRLTTTRPVVTLAGVDAHGGVGHRTEDTSRSLSGTIGIPSYDASFRTFSDRVVLDRPLSGAAAEDARAVYGAIRKGSVFTAIDALAGPALLDFHVEGGLDRDGMGSVLPDDSDATIIARATLPRDAQLILIHDGREAGRGRDEIRRGLAEARGAYRVEVRLPGAPGTPPVPWLVSNPIYFASSVLPPENAQRGASGEAPSGPPPPAAPFPWRIEKDPTSSGTLRTSDHEAALEYKLGDGTRNGQFVALATDLRRQAFRSIDLSLAGNRPLRVSVQVRRADGVRWGKSFYVDPSGTRLRIPLASLRPIDAVPGTAVSAADVTSILLVLDLANAAPGRSGALKVKASALMN